MVDMPENQTSKNENSTGILIETTPTFKRYNLLMDTSLFYFKQILQMFITLHIHQTIVSQTMITKNILY